MAYIILNWVTLRDMNIVTNEDGGWLVFDSEEEAEQYAQEQLNFHKKVVEIPDWTV